jgi:hypothetical protein
MNSFHICLFDELFERLDNCSTSSAVILEIGHMKSPFSSENFEWAIKNFELADKLAEFIIKRYGHRVKLIPSLIINDFAEKLTTESRYAMTRDLTLGCKYITNKTINIFSERTLRNRSVAKLKNKDLLSYSYDRVFFKGTDKVCQIPIANLSSTDRARIIPRCGLIIYSFIHDSALLAKQRLYKQKSPQINLVSFSQYQHETESMKIGADIYWLANDRNTNISYTMIHWQSDEQFCVYKRQSTEYKWNVTQSERYNEYENLTSASLVKSCRAAGYV